MPTPTLTVSILLLRVRECFRADLHAHPHFSQRLSQEIAVYISINAVLFVLFDFGHLETLKNRELILIFECFVNGYCRMSGQPKPKYNYLSRYTL
jgi:hypothetical protein